MTDYKNSIVPIENIQSMIFTIRGVQVLLDSDLAQIYDVKTNVFNQAVKRNIDRFPEEFRFQLTKEEFRELITNCDPLNLRSQIVTLKSGSGRGKHRKYLPYAFTEQGVSMLSAVLRSDTAVKVSIKIINVFVEMRRFIQSNANVFSRIESVEKKQLAFEIKTEETFENVFQALESPEPPKQGIFYDGQVYDAYCFVTDLIKKANKSLILIDNYVDDSVLTQLSKRKDKVTAVIYTKMISKQLVLDLKKHNQQYSPITIEVLKYAHDRFLIIDEKHIYHIGASLKDLGKKWFAISRFESGAVEMLKKLKGERK